MQQFCDSLSPSLLSNSLSILQIIFVSTAVINASIVYAIVATKNIRFPITNVAIKNAANIIAATKNGHLKIFCSAIDIIITAIGKAKNISKVFIVFSPFVSGKAAIKKRPLLQPSQKWESVIKVSSIRRRSGHFCRDVAAAQRTLLQTCALYSLLSGKYYTDFCTKVQEER